MIYVDLDNTLVDTIYKWIDFMNRLEDKRYNIKDLTCWESIYTLYKNSDEFFKHAPYKNSIKPFDGAIEFIEKLHLYDNVTILSDTNIYMREEKGEFIDKTFPKVAYIFTNGNKHLFVKENDVLIDDKIETIVSLDKGVGVLFNYNNEYCYNILNTPKNNVYCCKSYNEIFKVLDLLYK